MKRLQCPGTGLLLYASRSFFTFLLHPTLWIVREIFPSGICEVTKQRESEVWNDCGVLWLGLLICFGCSECGNVPASSTHTSGRKGGGSEGWGGGRGGWLGEGRNVSMQRSPSKILQGGQEEDTFMQIGAKILWCSHCIYFQETLIITECYVVKIIVEVPNFKC